MRRRLRGMSDLRPSRLSEPSGADRSRYAVASTSRSSGEPVKPRFSVQAPGATSTSNRSSLPIAQQQAEVQAPDLQSKAFKGWREKALRDHRNGTQDHRSVRLRIESLDLRQIKPETDVQPEPDKYDGEWQPEACELFWWEMKKDLAIKSGKVQREKAVSNGETLTFLKDW